MVPGVLVVLLMNVILLDHVIQKKLLNNIDKKYLSTYK